MKALALILVLLEPSSSPATFEECARARPELGRPMSVVSLQNGTGTPWHHRMCIWVCEQPIQQPKRKGLYL